LLIEQGLKRAIDKSDVLFKESFDRIEGKQTPDAQVAAQVASAGGQRGCTLGTPRT
jgi:hypothetical protein